MRHGPLFRVRQQVLHSVRRPAPEAPLRCSKRSFLHTSHLNAPRLPFFPDWQHGTAEAVTEFAQPQSAAATTAATCASPPPPQQRQQNDGSPRIDRHARNALSSREPARHESSTPLVDGYVFPVGRALRFVQLGQRLPQHQAEGREELQGLLNQLAAKMPSANVKGDGEGKSRACGTTGAASPIESPAPAEGEERVVKEEVSRFVLHHTHRLITGFKKLRQTLNRRQEDCQRATLKRVGSGDRRTRSAGRAVSSTAATLSPHDSEALTQVLFSAAVLLHLGGLYSVGETHVERLVETCFSITIFLAQDASARARQQSSTAASTEHPHGPSRPLKVESPSSTDCHKRCVHSLHWSIVHFAAAVRSWGLLEHTTPLQSLRKTQLPYQRLLQVHAALLCEAARGDVDQVLWRALLLLKSGHLAPAAQAAWFLNADVATYEEFFQHTDAECVEGVPTQLQQRRLQLLPLLWLSLLITQLRRHESAVHDTAHVRHGSPLSTIAQVGRGQTTALHRPEVGWSAARHAFTALLPLFHAQARLDVTTWAILHLLMLPRPAAAENASLIETCAFVARVEHCGAAQDLATALPHCLAEKADALVKAEQRTDELLALFLRRFLDASTEVREVQTLSVGCNSVQPHRGRVYAKGGVVSAAGVVLARLFAPQTTIHRPAQLYRALLNIPLCALRLPSLAFASSTGVPQPTVPPLPPPPSSSSLSLPVSVDGVRLVNMLLLRVLVQWRVETQRRGRHPPPQPQQHTVSSPASKIRAAAAAAAASAGEWEMEMSAVLQAAHHLHCLLVDAAGPHNGGRQQPAKVVDDLTGEEAAQQFSLLMHTVQAAARALCVQLSASLLPRRGALRDGNGGLPLSHSERRLLVVLDAELRQVLFYASSGHLEGSEESLAGTLPWKYQRAFSDLMD